MLNKDTNIEIGDHVILINANNIFTIEKNIGYLVTDINYDGHIALNNNNEHYYNPKRFKKDIKLVRKLKLDKIFKI